MGRSQRDLDQMTLWEFKVAWKSWRGFHAASLEEDHEAPPPMSDERLRELGIVGFN